MCGLIQRALFLVQSQGLTEVEESKSSSVRDLYAAHIVRQGLNKEGWKLVVTGAATAGFVGCSHEGCMHTHWTLVTYRALRRELHTFAQLLYPRKAYRHV